MNRRTTAALCLCAALPTFLTPYADAEVHLTIKQVTNIRPTHDGRYFGRASLQVLANGVWVMAYVHIAHDCVIGNKTIMANNTTLAGHVHVGDWVIWGGFSGAHQFCKIGAHAFLGMYSGVNRDIPAYTMVSGQPATVRGINSEGLRRRDFSADQIRNIKNAYRITFRSGKKLAEAIEEVAELAKTQPELDIYLESLRSSERGVAR